MTYSIKHHMGNLITTKPVIYLVNMSASDYQRCVWGGRGGGASVFTGKEAVSL